MSVLYLKARGKGKGNKFLLRNSIWIGKFQQGSRRENKTSKNKKVTHIALTCILCVDQSWLFSVMCYLCLFHLLFSLGTAKITCLSQPLICNCLWWGFIINLSSSPTTFFLPHSPTSSPLLSHFLLLALPSFHSPHPHPSSSQQVPYVVALYEFTMLSKLFINL